MGGIESISGVSADIFGLVGMVVLLVALGLAQGKDVLIAFLFSLYPAVLLANYFPYYNYIPVASVPIKMLIVLISVTIMAFMVLRNYIDTNYQHNSFWRFVEIFVLALAGVGFLIASLYHIVGIEALYDFSFVFDILFMSGQAMFLWLLLSLLSFPLFVRA